METNAMLKDRDIVCIANVPWDYLKIAAQQTMKYLASENRIIYVENALSMSGYLYERTLLKKTRDSQKKGICKALDNLYVLTPPLALPYRARSAISNKLTAARMLPHIKSAMRELGVKKPILWIYNAFAGSFIIGKLEESLVVYDCTDEFSADPKVNSDMYKKLEHEILGSAQVVLAISRNLVSDKKKYNNNVNYLPIGGEPDHFLTCHEEGLAVPEDIKSLKKPVIGYYGRLDERFDSGWCTALARKFPGASIALIGPMRGDETKTALKDIGNIHFLGSKDYSMLPAYLKAFDVCMMPYVMSEFVQNIFPNKIFEYLASGKPVITSDIPSLRDLADDGVVSIAKTEAEFLNMVDAGLSDCDADNIARRIETAKKNSWLSRADKASDIIEAYEKSV